MTNVKISCHFSEGGEPIGLAEVGDVPQYSVELSDFALSLPIRLVMAGRSPDMFHSHSLECLFPEVRGESWVSIANNRDRYYIRGKSMVPE